MTVQTSVIWGVTGRHREMEQRWRNHSEVLQYNATNLLGNLSKVVDEADGRRSLERIVNSVDVDVAFVEQMMENVDGLYSRRALLLVAEYQINPLVQTSTHIVTFQSL